ncbi:MAG: signal peptidase II [Clostridia bacterium]|nr:signal peptidase II [Clostridia bacterium]
MSLLYLLIPILGVALDQLTKHWAATQLQPVGTIPLWEGVFYFTYCENTGAAFSMLSDRRWLLLLITLVLLAVILYALLKDWVPTVFGRVCLLLILSGAIGNLLDRLIHGYVVDFLDFRLIRFPIFNVADILLNIGVFALLIYLLFIEPKHKKKENDRENDPVDGGAGRRE